MTAGLVCSSLRMNCTAIVFGASPADLWASQVCLVAALSNPRGKETLPTHREGVLSAALACQACRPTRQGHHSALAMPSQDGSFLCSLTKSLPALWHGRPSS